MPVAVAMAAEEPATKRLRTGRVLTVVVDDGELEVHSAILERASPVFAGMRTMKEAMTQDSNYRAKAKASWRLSTIPCSLSPWSL